jgi:cytochrome o ubiquinol oxidase subunit 1
MVAAFGTFIILMGVVCQAVQLVVSIRRRNQYRDVTGDPWNGRTLEWSTASPPPAWNYAVLPLVAEAEPFWSRKLALRAKENGQERSPKYEAIEMPENSATGFVTAFFAVVTGFALIWHIWWMVGLGLLGALMTMIAFAFREREEVEIPAWEVARFDQAHPRKVVL